LKNCRVRGNPKCLATKAFAGAAEPADDLVSGDEDVVRATDFLETFPVCDWRHNHSAGAHYWLCDERGDGLGIFAQNQLFKPALGSKGLR
jgi:hypothetical protein